MNQDLTGYEMAVEYGKHLFGVFPSGDEQHVTGLLHYKGDHFESYVETGQWSRYPNWIREYEQTPLADALEAFVEGREMFTTECSIRNTYYERQPLASAGLSGWRFEYERKRAFRSAILKGDVHLECPAIINRYGDVYAPPSEDYRIEGVYWNFVDEQFEHRHNHHTGVKTQSD